MATHIKFSKFSQKLFGNPEYGLSDIFVALTDIAPDPVNDVDLASITEIDYTYCSSRTLTTDTNYSSGIKYSLINNFILTASGGSVGPFRYVIFCSGIVNVANFMICYYDYGYSITLQDGQSLNLNFSTTNSLKGVLFTIQ